MGLRQRAKVALVLYKQVTVFMQSSSNTQGVVSLLQHRDNGLLVFIQRPFLINVTSPPSFFFFFGVGGNKRKKRTDKQEMRQPIVGPDKLLLGK